MGFWGFGAQFDYQERHKSVLCKVYFCALLLTIGLATFTFFTLKNTPSEGCPGTWVRNSLYLVLAMHATNIIQQVCTITGLENFCCSALCNLCFDVYEIAVLIFMMSQAINSTHCLERDDTNDVYYCLIANVVVYWCFFFISWFIKIHSYCAGPKADELNQELLEEEKAQQKLNQLA